MRKRLLVLLAILISFSFVAASCGDDSDDDASDTTTTGGGDGGDMPETDVSVGLVFDTTGRGDQSFNDSAAAGVDRAVDELGVEFTEATPNADGSNRAELLQLAADATLGQARRRIPHRRGSSNHFPSPQRGRLLPFG